MIAGAAIAPATIALNFTGVAVLKGQGSAEVTLTLNLNLTLTLTLPLPLPLTLPPTPTPNQVREKVMRGRPRAKRSTWLGEIKGDIGRY